MLWLQQTRIWEVQKRVRPRSISYSFILQRFRVWFSARFAASTLVDFPTHALEFRLSTDILVFSTVSTQTLGVTQAPPCPHRLCGPPSLHCVHIGSGGDPASTVSTDALGATQAPLCSHRLCRSPSLHCVHTHYGGHTDSTVSTEALGPTQPPLCPQRLWGPPSLYCVHTGSGGDPASTVSTQAPLRCTGDS